MSDRPWREYTWSSMPDEDRTRILTRSNHKVFDPELLRSVGEILEDVRVDGDAACSRALARFDGCDVPPDRLRVSEAEIAAAPGQVPEPVREAIRYGIESLRRFHARQTREREWEEEIRPGLVVGEKLTPVTRAAVFVPSGKASYPSVMMQLGTPAVVAGVPEIAVIVPPAPGGAGEVDPAVLFAASELGITEIHRANGPAGIAAAAFGTESVRPVRMIVGPGSPAVTAAQILVQTHGVVTNMLLGPSESLVIADDGADPEFIASDILNEAEHGPDSASLLVTPSRALADALVAIVERRLADLPEPRRSYARSSLTGYGGVILVDDLAQAAEVANAHAPEHMVVDVRDPDALLPLLVNAGEILVGPWTPISAANFAVGVPAALPTGGFAQVSSAITAHTFLKATSIARASRDALADMAGCVLPLCDHEGFPGHAASYRARGVGG